jgi:GAF domain-containing protein
MDNDNILLKAVELLQEFDNDQRDKFYQRIFELLREAIPYQYAALFLYDSAKGRLQLTSHIGRAVDLVEFVSFEMGRGMSAWVAKERKPILLNDLHAFSRRKYDIRSFLSLPMLSGGELVGVLNFGHEHTGMFPEEVAPRGMAIASLLAEVIAKNRLIRRLSAQNQHMEQMNRELRDAQTHLVKTEKKAVVSATIVSLNHEINNPLMIILGNLGLLAAKTSDPETGRRLRVIGEQAERIAATLRKVRTLEEPLLEHYLDDDDTPMLSLANGSADMAME